MPHSPRTPRASLRTLVAIAAAIVLAASSTGAFSQSKADKPLIQLRQHIEAAIARGDLRSAEVLVETYLPAAQRHPDPTWHLFSGHLIACRIKLALGKTDEAAAHSSELTAIVGRSKRTDTMEHAIAAITSAQVLQAQGRAPEAAERARAAITALRRTFERGRITRRTFDAELIGYEDVLIQSMAAQQARQEK